MKEGDCKKLRCCGPQPYNTGTLQEDAGIPLVYLCSGSACAGWVWVEALDRDDLGNMIGGTNYDTEGKCGLIR